MNIYTFDQLPIGKAEEMEISVTESEVDEFARFSGDNSSIHIDDAYAQSRGFKARLSHGLLVGSYISALLGMKLPGKHGLLQSISCDFRSPCYVPNTLTIKGVVKSRFESIRIVTIDISVLDQSGTLIVQAVAKSVLKE
jgi:3-hydroxybutyryl-CoA dehydratase